jgi:hypothetical protein
MKNKDIERYNAKKIKYKKTIIGKNGGIVKSYKNTPYVITPTKESVFYYRLNKKFNILNYKQPAIPPFLGIEKIKDINKVNTRVLRLLIKKNNSYKLKLPKELEILFPIINKIFETEFNINPKFYNYACHLTFDNGNIGENGYQRYPGFHVDGFQNHDSLLEIHENEHSYVWSDNQATLFALQPFFIEHLNFEVDDLHAELNRQVSNSNIYQGINNGIYLFDPYMVHSTPYFKNRKEKRNFIRITFEEIQLKDPVNSINLMFNKKIQKYIKRIDLRSRLNIIEKDNDLHLKSNLSKIGLKKV